MGALALTTASAALAELPEATAAHPAREIHSVAALAIFGGLVAFAVILSLLHLYERGSSRAEHRTPRLVPRPGTRSRPQGVRRWGTAITSGAMMRTAT
ncbi:hypothetical protein [Methylobacterium mesophilicum]|uniref:hypothetical protein n=1 Tax=Methylobacterium mesophilicum TaxID=39956 RepID=UPI002F359ADD